jgi:hypothetical protein
MSKEQIVLILRTLGFLTRAVVELRTYPTGSAAEGARLQVAIDRELQRLLKVAE